MGKLPFRHVEFTVIIRTVTINRHYEKLGPSLTEEAEELLLATEEDHDDTALDTPKDAPIPAACPTAVDTAELTPADRLEPIDALTEDDTALDTALAKAPRKGISPALQYTVQGIPRWPSGY